MKKALAILCAVGLLMLTATSLYAGGIINKNNQSADYMRTFNRAAATDLADIAVYNPAGIMHMDDGLYTKLDVMHFEKDYSNTVPNNFGIFNQAFGELDQDQSSTVPAFFTVLKKDRWAGFFAFSIVAGGGELDYEDGSARTVILANGVGQAINFDLTGNPAVPFDFIRSQKEEVKKSEAYGFTLGGSYAINDAWSVAAGLRYTTAEREFDGNVVLASSAGLAPDLPLELNISEDDDGWAGIFGVNYKPAKNLTLAATLITKTELEYERDVKKDTLLDPVSGLTLSQAAGFEDGSKIQDDVPGQLSLGVSYEFYIPLKVDLSYVRYFERSATIETFEDEGDSWDMGISAEYTFNPRWRASLGYLYTDIDIADEQQMEQPEEPKLDANSVAGGVVWTPTDKWAVTLAGAYIMYDEVEDSLGIEYDKNVWSISAGVQYKWF